LKAVDTLSLDYTNFMLMNAAPTLIREAAGYEQRAFAKDLEENRITFEKTRGWWEASSNILNAEADQRDPEGVRLPSDRPSSQKIYAHALLNLAVEQSALRQGSAPETLLLDFERLQRIRTESVRITVIGGILITAKNLLRRDSRSQWKNEAARMWQLLSNEPYTSPNDGDEETVTTAQKAFSILETAHNMPPTTKQQLVSTISRFFAQAAALSSPPSSSDSTPRLTDPVLKLLFQRLKTHIGTRLYASTSSEKVRATSGASEALASCGMPEFVEHVGRIVNLLDRIREVDWQAHGQWYRAL
jgi:hypothetical protein